MLLGMADALCEAKCVTRASVRSALVALVTIVSHPKEEEDVVVHVRFCACLRVQR